MWATHGGTGAFLVFSGVSVALGMFPSLHLPEYLCNGRSSTLPYHLVVSVLMALYCYWNRKFEKPRAIKAVFVGLLLGALLVNAAAGLYWCSSLSPVLSWMLAFVFLSEVVFAGTIAYKDSNPPREKSPETIEAPIEAAAPDVSRFSEKDQLWATLGLIAVHAATAVTLVFGFDEERALFGYLLFGIFGIIAYCVATWMGFWARRWFMMTCGVILDLVVALCGLVIGLNGGEVLGPTLGVASALMFVAQVYHVIVVKDSSN